MEDSFLSSKEEVKTYLDRLKYAIKNRKTTINFQEERNVDNNRPIRYTNRYTISYLFPDESPSEVLRRELKKLNSGDYLCTVKDTRYENRSDMYVFAVKYDAYVYIKIRVELLKHGHLSNYVFVMSFHYSDQEINEDVFPYMEKRGEK
ncbi:MAG TPA: hypothetical protein VJ878_01975 [Candidatus Izemoplasmatales bacterium]|nr:hypothetical protein [Candidatus Izemoplasmatales bacterium]